MRNPMANIDKIKDYVSNKRIPITGDASGSFTISPIGFPYTNRSGYGLNGGTIPTLFKPTITSSSASTTGLLYKHKAQMKFLRYDDDDNMLEVEGTLYPYPAYPGDAYKLVTDNCEFVDNTHVYTISINAVDNSSQYNSLCKRYTLQRSGNDYVVICSDGKMILPDEGLSIKFSYVPEDNDIIAVCSQSNPDENGIYKIYIEEKIDGNEFKWIRKGSLPIEGYNDGVQFDGTENDNVEGVYDDPGLNHYRIGKSNAEVASYLKQTMDEANRCGRFYGEKYPSNTHGLLVKWFLSNGSIDISARNKSVVIDGFGVVDSNAELGGCLIDNVDKEAIANRELLSGKTTNWIMSASTNKVDDESACDWPYQDKSDCFHNNITLNYSEMAEYGNKHNIVIKTDLSEYNDKIGPQKTFIHLPTPLDIPDGTQYDFNISMPITNLPEESSTLNAERLSGYYSYVTQPRAYLVTGLQKTLESCTIDADTLSVTSTSFNFLLKRTLENTDITSIAFSLYNREQCDKKFDYIGTVTTLSSNASFYTDSDGNVHRDILLVDNTVHMCVGDRVVIEYPDIIFNDGNPTGTTGTSRKYVTISKVKNNATTSQYELTLPYNLDPASDTGIVVYRTKVSATGTFPYDIKSRVWGLKSKYNTCVTNIRYLDNSTVHYEGLTERDNDSIFGSDPESDDITTSISAYNQNFRIDATETGKFNDKESVIAAIYPTATNTFPWRLNNRRRIRHLGLSNSASIDYNTSNDSLLVGTYSNNKQIYQYMLNANKVGGTSIASNPINYTRTSIGNSLIGSILRVALPSDIDADVDSTYDLDTFSVVNQATKAFQNLVHDMKISRIGYKFNASQYLDNTTMIEWFYPDAHSDESYTPSNLIASSEMGIIPEVSEFNQKMTEWCDKLIHIPNYTLGVYPGDSGERNYEYANWATFTTPDMQMFYNSNIDSVLTGEIDDVQYPANPIYAKSKTQGGTTSKTNETFIPISIAGEENSTPIIYSSLNSVLKIFINDWYNEDAKNRVSSYINGFMRNNCVKYGLRNLMYLQNTDSEFNSFKDECLYPMSKVFSADGLAFPDYAMSSVSSLTLTDDAIKKQIMAYPEVYVFSQDVSSNYASVSDGPIISLYRDYDSLNEYVKTLLSMYAQGMPFHLYDSHRIMLPYNGNGESITLGTEAYNHEITLYKRQLENVNDGEMSAYVKQAMQLHINADMARCFYSALDSNTMNMVDTNMTYQTIDASDLTTVPWEDLSSSASLSAPMQSASVNYLSSRFGSSFTRIHVSVIFSASLGKWIIKDYYQLPTNYLTPAYGAKTLGAMEKSYLESGFDVRRAEYRVAKSNGMDGNKFSYTKYANACPEQYLWKVQCGTSTNYKDGMRTLYSEQKPLDINPGCVPFLLETFPYNDTGHIIAENDIKFKNLYDYIQIPMDADGNQIGDMKPLVNFWSLKWNVRPARSSIPGSHIPSLESRNADGANISTPTLGMFEDISLDINIPDYK